MERLKPVPKEEIIQGPPDEAVTLPRNIILEEETVTGTRTVVVFPDGGQYIPGHGLVLV